jgi:hypothetical protein
MLSPTALQRLFHWQGERAVAAAADKFGLWFGISSLASVGMDEIGAKFAGPKLLQYYYHKDRGLNAALLEMAREAKFDAVALTVDTIVGGNRERCKRTGFTSPPRFTPASALSYAAKPRWALDYLFREKFSLPNLERHVAAGSDVAMSIQSYFSEMLDQTMDWTAAEKLRRDWGGKFALKGVMSVGDARRAVEIGADAIFISNHGDRQLDGARAVRSAGGDSRCRGRPDRSDPGWRRAARHPCSQGAGHGGEGGVGRPALPLCAGRRRAAGRGTRAGDSRSGDRARHEADGGHPRGPAHPRKATPPLRGGASLSAA